MRVGEQGGQGSVELVALLPLVVAMALGVGQLLAAGVGRELADHAAENGAIALADGEDPHAAVREALPGWAARRVRITVRGRRVGVRLVPVAVFPGVGEHLATVAQVDAGPAAGSSASATSANAAGSGFGLGAVTERTHDDVTGLEHTR